MPATHLTSADLDAGLDSIREAPRDQGTLEMVVRRPSVGEREVIDEGELDIVVGLIGDSWNTRHNRHRKDGVPDPDTQINIMGVRAIALIAQDKSRWSLAGDQLFLDLDLSGDNLPPGTQIEVGSAILQVSAEPHTGCGKFVERFGVDAMKFVNSATGRALCLRGINARVVRNGVVRVGDRARKI